MISDKEKIIQQRAEHVDSVLNNLSTFNDDAISRLPKLSISEVLADTATMLKTESDTLALQWQSTWFGLHPIWSISGKGHIPDKKAFQLF